MRKLIDFSGLRFGRLVVSHRVANSVSGAKMYLCVCDCGQTKDVRHGDLQQNKSTSCGCVQKEKLAQRSLKHGKSKNKVYDVWVTMKARCFNPLSADYKGYGGRGITVDPRWLHFANFYEDMGDAPSGMSLDRVNNEGNYSPENCRWADALTQANNRRDRSVYPDRDFAGKFTRKAINVPE